ncbi:MAG: deoxyribodipyrimidine photo-lyase [Candidatus Palauibacterales bacterium]|nr:deoxyribodipyrimidine photo-lyase [Candidatus Palauibacterales bacterium]
MTDYSFIPLREIDEPRPPEGWTGPWEPAARRRRWLREGEPHPDGDYVLYWMQMYQRHRSNPALEEAVRRGRDLGLPVVVYQGLNADYPGANARLHRFILESARDVARGLRERGIPYVFYPREENDGRDAAAEMIRASALAVTDDFPAYILPEMTRRAVAHTADAGVPVLAVDGNGVVPMDEIEGRQYAAYTIRPRIHRRLPSYLHPVEESEPDIAGRPDLPVDGIGRELAGADDEQLDRWVKAAGVDRSVEPSLRYRGGRRAGLERLEAFVEEDLADYAEHSRDPGADVASGLSPYLHFGCVSAREAALRVLAETAVPDESVDAFLEQLVVRRELAYNFCRRSDEHASLSVLPDWARTTLSEHADDPRDPLYDAGTLEAAETHDEVWNAAQRELVATGTIQGYLRMLWGKQIMRWTESHEEALGLMLDFHRRYALDGRNPNTYANVLWCFGLHDRAFQETPILGKTRPMSSDRTRQKFDLGPYFERVDRWVAERSPSVLGGDS